MVWFTAALGLVILLLAGDALVKGAVNLSLRLGVPAMIVSLTIVAFGTSAPELLIAIQAILEDAPGIAMGNVVGSNTANILLVLGVPALLAPLATSQCDTEKTYRFMIFGTVLFIVLAFFGPFTWLHGIVLLAALAYVLFDSAREAREHRNSCKSDDDEEDLEEADPSLSGWMIALYIVLGMIGLPMGADLLVESASEIAREFRVSDTVIGLTLVAVGTSLPELATTVMATIRRQADVALGNVIGSNMFNLLAIIGVASFFGDVPVARGILEFDIWVMLGASLLLMPFVFLKWDLGRVWGLIFTALYAVYIWAVIA